VTTYRLPPEPEGPVWRWERGPLKWVQYDRIGGWVKTDAPGVRPMFSWGELLDGGEVTSIRPIERPLAELREDIISAARSWQITRDDAQLLEVIGLYNRKLHQLNDERQNS
jgi:hypothetical protein